MTVPHCPYIYFFLVHRTSKNNFKICLCKCRKLGTSSSTAKRPDPKAFFMTFMHPDWQLLSALSRWLALILELDVPYSQVCVWRNFFRLKRKTTPQRHFDVPYMGYWRSASNQRKTFLNCRHPETFSCRWDICSRCENRRRLETRLLCGKRCSLSSLHFIASRGLSNARLEFVHFVPLSIKFILDFIFVQQNARSIVNCSRNGFQFDRWNASIFT